MTLKEALEKGGPFLALEDQDLKDLPRVIDRLGNVRVLYLSNCSMSGPTDHVWSLTNVEDLTVPVVNGAVPGGVRKFENLRKLTVVANYSPKPQGLNRLRELPTWLGELAMLENLTLKNPELEEISEPLYSASQLRHFHVTEGRIGEFAPGLSALAKLRTFALSSLEVPAVPVELGALVELQELRLWRVPISSLPAVALRAPKLATVAVTDSGLKTVPEELWEVKGLSTVELSGNPIGELSKHVAKAVKLQLLDVASCGLNRVPPELWQLSELRTLILSGNTFSDDAYVQLERAAAQHPNIEVSLPRRAKTRKKSAKKGKPRRTHHDALKQSVREDLTRLGAVPTTETAAAARESLEIGGTDYPVPTALRELLYGFKYPITFSAPSFDRSELRPVELAPGTYDLEEYELTHHAPYVQIGQSRGTRWLIRLDDEHPEDPMIYGLDNDAYARVEASEVGQLSQWFAHAKKA
jgi:Leucine-rich repeat (LRR) protein